jgi:predicted ribosomally synthesized peptide with SipW-like signal peptide
MKKRLFSSLALIVLVTSLLAAATMAVFSSQAQVQNNSYATGKLEVRVNGQPAITGISRYVYLNIRHLILF